MRLTSGLSAPTTTVEVRICSNQDCSSVSNKSCSGLKLEVSNNADAKYIVNHTQMIFRGINVTQLFVHLDFVEPGSLNGYK